MKYVDHVTCIQIYNLYYDIIMFSRMHAWCIGMYKYVVYARCIIWSCTYIHAVKLKCHRENGGTLGMVPLIINPVYTLYSGYLDVFIG